MAALTVLNNLAPWAAILLSMLLLGTVLLIVHMVRTSNAPMTVRIRLIGLWVQRGPDVDASAPAPEPTALAAGPASDESAADTSPTRQRQDRHRRRNRHT